MRSISHARDILLQHAYGIHTTRATLDVDIGVFVTGWDQFRTLKEAFATYGDIAEAKIITDHNTGRSRGFGSGPGGSARAPRRSSRRGAPGR